MIERYIFVSLLWGFTNPFIKRGAAGVESVSQKYQDPFKRQLAELWYLLTRWQYVFPLSLNLCGSLAYYYVLGQSDLTVTVPVVNALTFLMTILGGFFLGEKIEKKEHLIGLFLIIMGILICIV